MLLASGCGMVRSEPASVVGKPCPPLVRYSAEEQTKAADELDALEKLYQPCVACGFIEDYGLMREMCR